MKICRFGDNRVGVVQGDQVIDVTKAMEALPAVRWPWPHADLLIEHLPRLTPEIERLAKSGPKQPLRDLKLLSPVANPPKIIGVGRAYKAHADEAARDPGIAYGRTVETPPDTVRLFIKANTALVGPSQGVELRFLDRRNDHEGEFAVVIGKTGTDIPESRALDYVAGYCFGLDMSLRGPENPSQRKSIDSYAVLGPWLVTADEISNPDDISYTLAVNGQVRQRAHTRDLIFTISRMIAAAASFYTLYPGDVVMTGSPEGVAPVKPGDAIVMESPVIGRMEVPVRAH